MLLSLIFWLNMACTGAIHVRSLYGTVHLPMVDTESCGTNRCPVPTFSNNGPGELFREQLQAIKRAWKDHEEYGFRRQYAGRYSEIVASKTDCDMSPNGTFSCTPQPSDFCYAVVHLGFRAKPNSRVLVYRTNEPSRSFLGTGSIQIFLFGGETASVGVLLECTDGDHCLETQIAVLNILYRCN